MPTLPQVTVFAGTSVGGNAGARRALWAGRGMSALAVLFLAFDSLGKVLEVGPVVAATTQLGYPATQVFSIGALLASCLAAYVIPSTSLLGAVLLTGYLGGAIATQARVEAPLLSHTLVPVYVAAFVWGGLVLREARLRALLPWRAHQ